jgi:predicted O-methyltransferase YrrM
MPNWLDTYKHNYYPRLDSNLSGAKRGLAEGLGQRALGFQLMFELLLAKTQSQYHIVETGTCRNPGNWKDGQSAVIFTDFVKHTGGSLRSVDIDPDACAAARKHITSDLFQVTCSDSVQWLEQQTDLDQVDLFYLDSYDVKWNNDSASAEHHLREFQTIEARIQPGTVVAIDDNARFLNNGTRTGKGRRIVEYLESKGIQPLYDAYQIIYQL